MREGERNGRVKLTWKQVEDIRWTYENCGSSQKDLAEEYGVVQSTIWCIVKNLTWKKPGERGLPNWKKIDPTLLNQQQEKYHGQRI